MHVWLRWGPRAIARTPDQDPEPERCVRFLGNPRTFSGPAREAYCSWTRRPFENETGGKELSGIYLMDNTRLVEEFGVQYQPYPRRVLQIINEIRAGKGQPPIEAG